MDDLDRYAQQRAEHEPAFADGLERASAAFRVGVCLQQAREDAGLTRGEVASRLGTKVTTVGRMETNAGDVRLSTLQAYAELVGQRLVLEVRAARGAVEKATRPARPHAPRSASPRAPRPPRQMRSLSAQEEWL